MDHMIIPGKKKFRISLLVADPDQEYIQDIKLYYEKNEPLISVQETRTWDGVKNFLLEQPVDVLIINRQLIEESDLQIRLLELEELGLAKVIIVSENLKDLNKDLEFDHTRLFVDVMYKYTPMNLYTQRILSFSYSNRLEKDEPDLAPSPADQNKLVVFYSPKGGVGKTTLAVNTACQLALKNKRVLLIDFAIFGHISVMFSLSQRVKGLTEVIGVIEQEQEQKQEQKQLDTELPNVLLKSIQQVKVRDKSIDLLSAASPIKMSGLNLNITDKIIEAALTLDYDVIICDTSIELSEKNIALLSAATDLFYVTTTDITTNWSLLLSIDLVHSLNRPTKRQHLILNRYNSSLGFPVEEMESVLSMKVTETVPDAYEQIQGYANKGILLADKHLLDIHKYFRKVAHCILPVFTEKELGKKRPFSLKGVLKSGIRGSHKT